MNTKKTYNLKNLEKSYGPMTMARFLRSWREADDIAPVNFAKSLNITRSNLCDYEKGRKFVGPERAISFAKILGVPEETLLQIAIQDSLRSAKLDYEIEIKVVKKYS